MPQGHDDSRAGSVTFSAGDHILKGHRSRQDKTTTPQKARSHESRSAATKKCLSLLEMNSSQRDTAHCSAVLAQSGTDVMVPLIP